MFTTKVSSKGSIVIPKEIREAEGLHPGKEVAFVRYAGRVNIVPVPDNPIDASYGFLQEHPPLYEGPSIRQELVMEHQREVEQEKASLKPQVSSHESVRP